MRKLLKWIAFFLVGLAALLLVVMGLVYALSEARFNQKYEIAVGEVVIPDDPETIAYGEHIANIRGCRTCHGDDLSGEIEFEDPLVGVIANANLTGGVGSEVIGYSTADWDRSIRHGIGPDGKPLLIMPSNQHNIMSDEDLGALLAYIDSLPPVDNELPDLTLALLPRVMFLSGSMDFLVPAELIDHDAPRSSAPEREVTVEYGAYLAGLCSLCHGPGFSGGPIPGTPPGELAGWTFQEFLTAMRTGITPDDRRLREEYMPYETLFGEITDEEWEAIWLYLQTLPPREYGNR